MEFVKLHSSEHDILSDHSTSGHEENRPIYIVFDHNPIEYGYLQIPDARYKIA